MPKTPEVKYRAWDKRLNKMRTVLTVSFREQYITCKDKPNEKVSFSDIELLRHMGIAGENRKGIYEGDIISFQEGDDTHVGVMVRTDKDEWFIQMPKTGGEIPFPWNNRNKIHVLGNRFEDDYYLSDEYSRFIYISRIKDILSAHNICEEQYCRHDFEKATESLSELTKEELIEMVKDLSGSLRYYIKAYLNELPPVRHK